MSQLFKTIQEKARTHCLSILQVVVWRPGANKMAVDQSSLPLDTIMELLTIDIIIIIIRTIECLWSTYDNTDQLITATQTHMHNHKLLMQYSSRKQWWLTLGSPMHLMTLLELMMRPVWAIKRCPMRCTRSFSLWGPGDRFAIAKNDVHASCMVDNRP